jgi:uncharacterized OsmC-like protein
VDIRALQRPLKEGYREDPGSSRITLVAGGAQGAAPVSCSVEVGRALHAAEAHPGVGGPGAAACSGDMLLGALAACAQITCQMVAAAMGVPIASVAVTVQGDLDLQGTLGTRRDVPVGFEEIRVRFDVDAPQADPAALASLREKTERYCVVMQTLTAPPRLATTWSSP